MKRFLSLLTAIAFMGITNVWGVNHDHTIAPNSRISMTGSTLPTGWSGSAACSYMGGYGQKKKSGAWEVHNYSISDFSSLDYTEIQDVKVTITVKGMTNSQSGDNTCTVTLTSSTGTKISNYTSTKNNEFGSGTGTPNTNGSDVSFEFSVTVSGVTGYRINCGGGSCVANTTYKIEYNDKPAASCSNKLNFTKSVSGNGSFY